jgi:hypothetical protein
MCPGAAGRARCPTPKGEAVNEAFTSGPHVLIDRIGSRDRAALGRVPGRLCRARAPTAPEPLAPLAAGQAARRWCGLVWWGGFLHPVAISGR